LPSIGVTSYSVTTDRRAIPGAVIESTYIVLTPEPGGPVSVASLFYQSTDVVGYLFESQLSAYFPWDALETHFGMLQSENPIYIQWGFDPASPNPVQLTQFALATGDQFPGEGPTDTSP
jgi:hypothetical protein